MEKRAICLSPEDNVVTLTEAAEAGDVVVYAVGDEMRRVTAGEAVPIWHKVALVDLPVGAEVRKYGEVIGVTTQPVQRGGWVSHENIKSVPRDYASEYQTEGHGLAAISKGEAGSGAAAPGEQTAAAGVRSGRSFLGYARREGRPGIRNYVLILPTCACASESCRLVASQVAGTKNVIFNTGCSDVAANTAMSQKILTGFALHPNVYGVVIIGLGCETVPHAKLRAEVEAATSKPVVSFGIQEEGGTVKTVAKAVRAAREMVAQAAAQPRVACDIADLLIGIECGGSDATSGIAANPAVGNMSDRLVDLGASTIMSESIEWIGGEHVLARRAATPELHDAIIAVCEQYEEHLLRAGQDCRAGQPTPGNKAGGLSTIDEKSLGCIRKGGTRPVVEVLEQAVRPSQRGAIVMDTAGYDISSVTSMVAAGCQAVVFTTGRGTPTGNAIAPVLKVTANEHTYSWMEDNMDVDLSPIIRGEQTIEAMGERLVDRIAAVAGGQMTKAEAYGFSDIAVDHVCRYV